MNIKSKIIKIYKVKNILISCVGGMLTYDFVRSLRENTEFKFKLI